MADRLLTPRALLPLLVAFAAVGPVTLNLPLPAVPGLARQFDTDPGVIQLIITLYLAGMAFSQLVLGPLSDRYGRRPVLVGALALGFVMSVAAALAPNAGLLILARVLQSFGASSGLVISRAIIRDVFDRDRAASMIGWVTMAMVVAPMVSPTIGGFLEQQVGWRWTFGGSAVLMAVVLVLAVTRLPETRATAASPGAGQLLADARALLVHRRFLGYLLVGALSSVTFFAFIGGAPHAVVTVMGQSSTSYGLWFMINAAGYMIGNAICGRYAGRFGSDRLMAWGSLLMVAAATVQFAIAGLGFMTHPAMLFVPQAVIALANGLQLPGAIAGAVSVNPQAAGSASGLAGFCQMGLGAIAAQIAGMGVAAFMSPLPMVLLVVAGAWGSLAAQRLLRHKS